MALHFLIKCLSVIAALKGQFLGHCYQSIVFSKGPQTFSGDILGEYGVCSDHKKNFGVGPKINVVMRVVKLGPKWSICMLKSGFLGLLIIRNLFIYFQVCLF